MAHFAKVENGVVTQVIVIDQETLNTGHWGDPSLWIQTSYNTFGGQHPEGRPLRKNYAGVGYTYDAQRDAFIPPKPSFTSWVLNESTCQWEAPTPMPVEAGKMFTWNEATTSWIEFVPRPPMPVEEGKGFRWDESTLSWVEVPKPVVEGKVFHWNESTSSWVETVTPNL